MRELNILRFIHKQRVKKMAQLYKLAFSIIVDKVTLIYVSLLTMIGLMIFIDYMDHYTLYIQWINKNRLYLSIYFMIVVSVFYPVKGFLDPRYKVTTSDYNLSLLTYDIYKVVKILIISQQIKRLFIGASILFSFYLLQIFTLSTTILFIITFVLTDLLTGMLQWRHFQSPFKSFVISAPYILSIIFLEFFTNLSTHLTFILLCILLVVLTLVQFHINLFRRVQWNEVIAISDEKTWHLLIVKLITGVGFNIVPNRLRMPQKNKLKVKETPYELSAIVARYWKNYFILNKHIPFHIITNCSAILIFFHININMPSGLYLVLPIITCMYWLYSLLMQKLDTSSFKVLPFTLECHARGFYIATRWLLIVLLLVHAIFLIFLSSVLNRFVGFIVISEWLLINFIFTSLLKLGMMRHLNLKNALTLHHFGLVICLTLLVVGIECFPMMSVFVIAIFGFKFINKNALKVID